MKNCIHFFYWSFLCLIITACNDHQRAKAHNQQQANADSLVSYMRTVVNPLFHDQQLDESRRIIDSLAPIVAAQKNDLLTCNLLRFQGVQLLMEKKYDSAEKILRRSLALAEAKDTSRQQVIAAKTQLADLFIETKQPDSGLAFAHEAYYLAKKTGNANLPMILLKLSSLYQDIGNGPSTRQYLFEGWNASQHSPKYKFAFASNIAKYYDDLHLFDSAALFYQQYIDNDTSFSNPYIDAVKFENQGIRLTRQGKLKEGLVYQLKALKLNREIGQLDALTLFNTGVNYSKLKQFDSAFRYYGEAEPKAKEEENYELVTRIWKRRSGDLYSQGRYQEAYAALDSAYEHFGVEVDSSFAVKARELETQYAVRSKDDEIRSLAQTNAAALQIRRQQQWIIVILCAAMVLVTILGMLWQRRRKLAEKLRQTELEQQLLRSQMEPHFIFNTLAVLQSYIRNQESEKAVRYLNQFARLLRVSLENSRQSFVPLKEEVAALENYLSLQSMRFEGSFDYHIEVYEWYEEDDLLIPPMLLQPFVENSILHGLKQIDHKGHIRIEIRKDQHLLHCVIEDNGRGLQPATHQGKPSLSTLITRERLDILSRQTRQPAGITVTDRKEKQQQGTRVELTIPFKKAGAQIGSGEKSGGF